MDLKKQILIITNRIIKLAKKNKELVEKKNGISSTDEYFNSLVIEIIECEILIKSLSTKSSSLMKLLKEY